MMELTRIDKALLSLVRSGLWESENDSQEIFPLSEDEWMAVLNAAEKQTVVGLVYLGIDYLPEALLPSDIFLARLASKAQRIEERNERVDKVLERLWAYFTKDYVHPILLKGQAVAALYKHPELRASGDIDLYFSKEEIVKSVLLANCTWTLFMDSDGCFCYDVDGVHIEQHPRIFDLAAPKRKKKTEELLMSYPFEPDPSKKYMTTPPLLTMLLLNVHILHHAIGRGIGLRLFCDYAVAFKRLEGRYDPERLEGIIADLGLKKWSAVLHDIEKRYLGLDCKQSPVNKKISDRCFERVLSGGNFGIESGWGEGRFRTFLAFCRNFRFSLFAAPSETFWTMWRLARRKGL